MKIHSSFQKYACIMCMASDPKYRGRADAKTRVCKQKCVSVQQVKEPLVQIKVKADEEGTQEQPRSREQDGYLSGASL